MESLYHHYPYGDVFSAVRTSTEVLWDHKVARVLRSHLLSPALSPGQESLWQHLHYLHTSGDTRSWG